MKILESFSTRLMASFSRVIDPGISAQMAQCMPIEVLLKILKVNLSKSQHRHVAQIASHLEPRKVAEMMQYMDPKDTAGIAEYCPLKMMQEVTPFLPPLLLSSICKHLSAPKIAQLVNDLPENQLRECVSLMIDQGMGPKLGEVSDLLEFEELMLSIARLNDPRSTAVITAHMTTFRKVARVTQALKQEFLAEILRYLIGSKMVSPQ